MRPTRVLQLVGSPTNDLYRELSELYARGCIDALADPARYDFRIAHVAPGGAWRFPASLAPDDVAAAAPRTFVEAVATIAELAPDAAIPQMFCLRGMTEFRALLGTLAIPYLGNTPLVMALSADKAKTKAIVAAAGVAVPRGELVRAGAGSRPSIPTPAVVKPNDADNSEGVTLVHDPADLATAIATASRFSADVLVEEFVPLGREVRCGIVERGGELVVLPLEEYFVDAASRPVRRAEDKLKRKETGALVLGAKTRAESWIVASDDPVVPAVAEAARRAYVALGCRQYGLFDFRIDPAGRPWFLEAGPYCSYAPSSVVVTMAEAAGIPLRTLFADALDALLTGAATLVPMRGEP